MSVKNENIKTGEVKVVDDVGEDYVVVGAPEDKTVLDEDKLAALKAKMSAKESAAHPKSEQSEEPEEEEEMPPRIVEKRNRTVDFGVVGSGQGGSRLCEVFYELGYDAVAFNTAPQDLEMINLPEANKMVLAYGLGGASKDPQIGHDAAQQHIDGINELILNKLSDCNMYVFCTSLGGGSGGGSIDTMLDILSSHGKPVIVVTVLPMINEDAQTKKNSLNALAKLAKKVQDRQIHNLVVVDNAKIQTILSDVGQMNFFGVANRAIVEPLHVFNTFSSKSSQTKPLDPMELSKILIDGGGLSLYGSMAVQNYQEDETAIAEAVINNLDAGLLAGGFDLKQTKYAGIIIMASQAVWDKIPASSLDYAMHMIQDQAGTPLGIFRGEYVIDTDEDVVKVYSFFSGLALPDQRVEELKKEVSAHLQTLKNKDTKRNLNLNIDMGETDTTSAAQKVRDKIAKKKSTFGQFLQKNKNVIDKRRK